MYSKTMLAILIGGAMALPITGYSQNPEPSKPRGAISENVHDAAITTKVKAAMAKDKEVSARAIKVETEKGVVNLSGTAKTRAEADKAVELARAVEGVSSVKSNITVEPN